MIRWLVLIGFGCTQAEPLPVPPGGQAVLLMFEDADGAKLFGLDATAPASPPLALSEEAALYALVYDVPLVDLVIPPGMVGDLEGPEIGRRLASGYRAHRARLDVDPPAWTPIEATDLPDSIQMFELPGLGIGACEEKGGCFRFEASEDRCQVPCTEPIRELVPPAPPTEPAPPEMTPCLAGFEEVPPEGARDFPICRPLEESCLGGEVHFLGDATCTPLGGACPSGDFSEALPPGPILYVLAGSPGPGDGSLTSPFPTIGSALAAASSGEVVAVGKGIYDEVVTIDRDVHVIGACRETVVMTTAVGIRAIVEITSSATVSNLRIEPRAAAGVAVEPLAFATLRDLEIGGLETGVAVSGRAVASRIAVLGTTLVAVTVSHRASLDRLFLSGGVDGLDVSGTADITNLRAVDLSEDALEVSDGSIDVEGFSARNVGRGLDVLESGSAVVSRAHVTGATDYPIRVRDASLAADRIVLFENETGVEIARSAVTITDSWMGLPARESNLTASGASTVMIERSVLSGAKKFGVHAAGARMILRDVRIRDNFLDRQDGEGIVAARESTVDAVRVAVERVGDFGIRVVDAEGASELILEDVLVADVLPTASASYGVQIGDYFPPRPVAASLTATRLSISGAQYGIELVTGESNRIEDLSVADVDTAARTIGGVLVVTRARIQGVRGGFSVASGEMELNHLALTEADIGLVSAGFVNTSVSGVDSHVSLNRFEISKAKKGILLEQNSRSTLRTGLVSECDIGLEVAANGYDLCMVEGDVIYRMNESHNVLVTGTSASHCSVSALSSSLVMGP